MSPYRDDLAAALARAQAAEDELAEVRRWICSIRPPRRKRLPDGWRMALEVLGVAAFGAALALLIALWLHAAGVPLP